jgi:hypothetical protein
VQLQASQPASQPNISFSALVKPDRTGLRPTRICCLAQISLSRDTSCCLTAHRASYVVERGRWAVSRDPTSRLFTLQPPRKQRPDEPQVFQPPQHKARPTKCDCARAPCAHRRGHGTAGPRPGCQEKRPGRHLPSTLIPARIAPRACRRDGRRPARARRGTPGRRRLRR